MKIIPLSDFPGYYAGRNGIFKKNGHFEKLKADRVPACRHQRMRLSGNNKQYYWFKVWFLRFIASNPPVSPFIRGTETWDIKGYQLFKMLWEPVFADGNKHNISEKNILFRPKERISMFDILIDDIEYKWWYEMISEFTRKRTMDFNNDVIKQALEDKLHLSNENKIIHFWGKVFKRPGSDIERYLYSHIHK